MYTINVTHTSPDVDASLGLQQHFDNFTVAISTGYVQRCPPILRRCTETSELILREYNINRGITSPFVECQHEP